MRDLYLLARIIKFKNFKVKIKPKYIFIPRPSALQISLDPLRHTAIYFGGYF